MLNGQPDADPRPASIFLAVVDEGSFNGARKLNRAVSVISYGIVNLEAQLGVSLFEREGSKKPKLTEAGQAVLSEARTIANDVDGLRAKVRGLLEWPGAGVALAVDVLILARVAAIPRIPVRLPDRRLAPACRGASSYRRCCSTDSAIGHRRSGDR